MSMCSTWRATPWARCGLIRKMPDSARMWRHTPWPFSKAANIPSGRDFIDFMLSTEVQSFLARLYRETPVTPEAEHGSVKPLAEIRRIDAPVDKIAADFDSTRGLLQSKGLGSAATH